eukprot:Skav232134  [mRNA]  locus=scaffold1744:147934:150506:- [translate_table: standard]
MGHDHCLIVTADSLLERPAALSPVLPAASGSSKMYSWGTGDKGQLGTGSMQAADTPQFITYPTDVLDVAAGEDIVGGSEFNVTLDDAKAASVSPGATLLVVDWAWAVVSRMAQGSSDLKAWEVLLRSLGFNTFAHSQEQLSPKRVVIEDPEVWEDVNSMKMSEMEHASCRGVDMAMER